MLVDEDSLSVVSCAPILLDQEKRLRPHSCQLLPKTGYQLELYENFALMTRFLYVCKKLNIQRRFASTISKWKMIQNLRVFTVKRTKRIFINADPDRDPDPEIYICFDQKLQFTIPRTT
jgi:hypothetical protein